MQVLFNIIRVKQIVFIWINTKERNTEIRDYKNSWNGTTINLRSVQWRNRIMIHKQRIPSHSHYEQIFSFVRRKLLQLRKKGLWFHEQKVYQPIMVWLQQFLMSNIPMKKFMNRINSQRGILCIEILRLAYCLTMIKLKYYTTYHHMRSTIIHIKLKMKITIKIKIGMMRCNF